MSTSNFYNDKNGIFVLTGSINFDNNLDDIEFIKNDFMEEMENTLEKINWSMTDLDNDDNCFIYDSKGRAAGKITLTSGYYYGIQAIYRNGHDLYNDYLQQGYDENTNDYNFHHKYVIKALKKITDCIKCIGVFSNGEAIYENA